MEDVANSISQDLPLAGDYHGIGGMSFINFKLHAIFINEYI